MTDLHPDREAFDFDHWARLARKDPEAFEAARQRVIESAIARALPARRPRLRGLQWRLDQVRRTAPNPMQACIRMNALLWNSVCDDDGLLARLQRLRAPGDARPRRKSAEILLFRR